MDGSSEKTKTNGNPKQKPWRDSNGKLLTLNRLRVASQRWSRQTWDEYLTTLEAFPTEETSEYFDDLLKQYEATQSTDASPPSEDGQDISHVKFAVDQLPTLERDTIIALFWEGLSMREVARLFQISRRAVFNIRNRGLNRLREKLRATTRAIGGYHFCVKKADSISETKEEPETFLQVRLLQFNCEFPEMKKSEPICQYI